MAAVSIFALILATAINSGNGMKNGTFESNDDSVRIVGGNEANPNSIPWQAALVRRGGTTPFCGGTIICPRYVMTAAHCTGRGASRIQVIAGEHDLDQDMSTDRATRHNIARIINHPNYRSSASVPDYDFSLLSLSNVIDLSSRSNAKAACLPTLGDNSFPSGFVVSGWGRRSENGPQNRKLHHVRVPWVSDSTCRRVYGSYVTARMICAGNIQSGGVDSCSGDSGGPLTYRTGTTTKLIGIVSWGAGCALAGRPGVYAKVTSVLSWVRQTIGNCAQGIECGKSDGGSGGGGGAVTTKAPETCRDKRPFCRIINPFWCFIVSPICPKKCGRC